MKLPHLLTLSCSLLALLATATATDAASGATLTPDRLSYMVNKDVGTDRWTINLNLSSDDPPRFLNASGNIFRSDGGPPSFVLCQVRPDSTGTLSDPKSIFRFTCTGTDPCLTNARGCSQAQWLEIPGGNDVSVPAEFFLPAGGAGAPAHLVPPHATPEAQQSQGSSASRGATLSSDGFNFLVNKDVGAERWSISLNLIPVRTEAGGIETRISSVTGNVFQPDGSSPSFIYCMPRPDSLGRLAVASSEFRFTCLGADACTTTASECATNGWRPIAGGDDLVLKAAFFLPPGGLADLEVSDPEIVVIGRTSDPPSIVSPEYRLVGESSSLYERIFGGACPVGRACEVPQLGGCQDVAGTVVQVAFCGCQVTDVPGACITCGSGASGTCGSGCEYPVGTQGLEARGSCLPAVSDAGTCQCYAVPAATDLVLEGCAGTLDGTCPASRCCADDPSDGCATTTGGVSCPGLCVASGDCDPSSEQCGICGEPTTCGNGRRDQLDTCEGADLAGATCASVFPGSTGTLSCTPRCTLDTTRCEPTPTPTPSPGPTVTTTPSPSPTVDIPCGNGAIDPGEQCDGSNLGGETCVSRGFCGGQLRCTTDCQFDEQQCAGTGDLSNGTSCETSACCTSGVCAGTIDAPEARTCIPCPKLDEECSEAACCDPFDQLECQPANGSSFCCIGSQFSCVGDADCCSGQCQAGICQ